jgi:hypothetical protein
MTYVPPSESNAVDLFCIGGQSNAEGKGDSTSSPSLTSEAALLYDGTSLSALADPIGGAESGSAWPAFAQQYYRLTGQRSVWIEYAKDGSAQHTDADAFGDGSWDSAGTLRSDLSTGVNDTMTYLNEQGYDPTFRGIVWAQGERDAQQIDAGNSTVTKYRNALNGMLDYFDGEFDDPWSLFFFELGTEPTYSVACDNVRTEQREVCQSDDRALHVSGVQESFYDRGLMLSDDLHYNQTGLNVMGRTGAETLVNGPVKYGSENGSVYEWTPTLTLTGGSLQWNSGVTSGTAKFLYSIGETNGAAIAAEKSTDASTGEHSITFRQTNSTSVTDPTIEVTITQTKE